MTCSQYLPGYVKGKLNKEGDLVALLSLPKGSSVADELHRIKARLAAEITRQVKQRKLTQVEAADIVQADRAVISRIKNGKLDKLSLEYLIRMLACLDVKVNLTIEESK
jgi:predicted XRE-type DNA-binding protein